MAPLLHVTNSQCQYRVDSDIESSLEEIIGYTNFTLNSFNLNFAEVIMNANKVIPENFVVVS